MPRIPILTLRRKVLRKIVNLGRFRNDAYLSPSTESQNVFERRIFVLKVVNE